MSKATDLALPLIQHFEGCRLDAYQDSVGVWTIGYGHTGGVTAGDSLSQWDADRLLVSDISRTEADVLGLLDPLNLPDCQVAALISFVFNLGAGALRTSTLLKRIRAGEASHVDANDDFSGPGAEFGKWNHAGGKVLDGLTKRRLAEARLFCDEDWT